MENDGKCFFKDKTPDNLSVNCSTVSLICSTIVHCVAANILVVSSVILENGAIRPFNTHM